MPCLLADIKLHFGDSLDDRLPGLAAEISFYLLLSLPPLLLVGLGLLSYVGDFYGPDAVTGVTDTIVDAASGVLKSAKELTLHHFDWAMHINAAALLPIAQQFLKLRGEDVALGSFDDDTHRVAQSLEIVAILEEIDDERMRHRDHLFEACIGLELAHLPAEQQREQTEHRNQRPANAQQELRQPGT